MGMPSSDAIVPLVSQGIINTHHRPVSLSYSASYYIVRRDPPERITVEANQWVDPLRRLNQPRVIAEVIGGIILGPSVMMRIPGFEA